MAAEYLLTTEAAPHGMVIETVFTMIQLTKRIDVTAGGGDPQDYQDALDLLRTAVPDQANAIIGVRVASTTAPVGNKLFLYLTYTGTPAVIRHVE